MGKSGSINFGWTESLVNTGRGWTARLYNVDKLGEGCLLLLCLAGVAALNALFIVFLHPTYQTNDDAALRTIAAGIRTGQPSEYLIYINILVGKPLKFLYERWPDMFWYDLMLYSFLLAAGATLAYALLRQRGRSCWVAQTIILLILARAALEPQFTIIAGLCATAAVVLFVSVWRHPPESSAARICTGILVIGCSVLAVLMRWNQALLVAMVGIVIAAPFLIHGLQQAPRRWAVTTTVFALVLAFGAHAVSKAAYYQDPGFREFSKYSSASVRVREYSPTLAPASPEDRATFAEIGWRTDNLLEDPAALAEVGWSYTDYAMFLSWFDADRNLFSTDRVRRLGQRLAEAKPRISLADVVTAVQPGDLVGKHLDLVLVVLASILLFGGGSRAFSIFLFGGAVVVIVLASVAVLFKPVPFRVSFPVVVVWLALTLLFAQTREAAPTSEGENNWLPPYVMAIVILLFAWPLVRQLMTIHQTNQKYVLLLAEDFSRYKPPESRVHVFWGGAGLTQYWLLPFEEPAARLNRINIGWGLSSPHGTAQLRQWNVKNLALELCQRRDLVLVAHTSLHSLLRYFVLSKFELTDIRFEPVFEGNLLKVHRCLARAPDRFGQDFEAIDAEAVSGVTGIGENVEMKALGAGK